MSHICIIKRAYIKFRDELKQMINKYMHHVGVTCLCIKEKNNKDNNNIIILEVELKP
jgi:hypothetical protein